MNADQAKAVVRIFEMSAAGYGNRRIVSALNADSVPAPTARGWSKTAIKAILRREVYRGVITYGKTRNDAKGGVAERRVATDRRIGSSRRTVP